MEKVSYQDEKSTWNTPYVILIILGTLIMIFSFNLEYETGIEPVDYGLRAFYHVNTEHLIANGISLLLLSTLETALGWKRFLTLVLFLWVTSCLILYGIHAAFPSQKVKTVGFSGVIYGLYVVYFSMLGKTKYINLGILIASIIPQFFIKGVSFEGHISGIVAGGLWLLLFPNS